MPLLDVAINTMASAFGPFFGTAPVPGAFTTLIPKIASPVGDGTIQIATAGFSRTNFAKLLFFGDGSNGNTFNAKVIGWFRVQKNGNEQWIPITLANVSCTLGATAGVGTGVPPLSPDLMVTTIVVNSSVANFDLVPSDSGIQMLRLDVAGAEYLQLQIGTGNAGHGNGLLAGF